jgi:hypothetical protein
MGKLLCICGNILSDTCGPDAMAYAQYEEYSDLEDQEKIILPTLENRS